MRRTVGLAMASGLCAVALGACSSTRFAGPAPVARTGPVYSAPGPVIDPNAAAPAGTVSSQPLPPPPGTHAPGAPEVQAIPASPQPVEPLPPLQPPQMAAVAPSRAAVVGSWTAREASGSCRLQLSSAPALDLYRASAVGCSNRDLARVSAWDFRDGEVYLYQPGGAVAARLRPAGASMEGVLAKSGAPLSLAR